MWQKLVPTVDGKRVALQEFLVFNEEVRDILVDTPVEMLAAKTRELLKTRGKPMLSAAEEKLNQGIISEKTYMMLSKGSKRADQDAEIAPTT